MNLRKHLSGFSMQRMMCMLLALLTVAMWIFIPYAVPEAKGAANKISIPSPSEYFGEIDETDNGNNSTVYIFEGYSTYPKAKMNSYISELKKAGLSGGTVEKQSNGDMLASFKYDGKWAMSIRWKKKDQHVWTNISNRLNIEKAADTASTTTTKTGAFPMPRDYFKNLKKDYLDESTYAICYVYSYNSYPDSTVDKYADALEALGFDTSYDISTSSGHTRTVRYGTTLCIDIKYKAKAKELTVAMYINGLEKAGYNYSGPKLPQQEETEPAPKPTTPKPTTPKPTEEDIPGETKQCGTCYGDGDCPSCGGKGYKMKWVSGTKREYVQQTCTTCFGMKKCYSCGGDGWKYK